MTAISQDLQFFENQSSYTNKGDLYNTGNTMLTAIKTFRDELEAQKVAANTTVATTTTAYTNMFNNLSSALTQNNTISSLNNLSVDEGLYNDKVDIFGNAKGVSLNNARASYTGYYCVRFNKSIPTTTLEAGFSYSNGVLTIIPINLTIPITSEINHLYVERTASLLGVWLNGILVSSNNVTVYKSLAFTPPATHSFSIYADQVRTFSSALTVTEIARLLYQFANKFTPEPLFAGSTMPYTVSSGNPIYTNFNTSALGFDKTVIVKPTLTLETGEFINTSLTQIDFNVNTNTDISVCLVVGLGNLNASTTTVTLLPRVTTPNTTIVLNSSNATEWNDGYSVSASSTYAGISSATAVSTLTTYPINPLTTTTKLVSNNITASNSSIIKVKVGGVVTDIPANSPYTVESITPSIDYRGLVYGMANTVVFNGTSTLLDTGVSQTALKDADFILELELNPTVWDAYRGVIGDHTPTPSGISGFQNGFDFSYFQSYNPALSLTVPNTKPADLFPINTWSKVKVEQKVINSTQVVVSVFVNDVLINRGIGNKLISSGGNLIIGRGFNGSDRYFSGSMRNIKLIKRSASQPTPAVTGGNYVDLYASGNYVWGLYLTTTVATIVRTNTFDIAVPTTYQLPLFYSDYRLSYVSDTEMYVVGATKQYKFDGSSFTAIATDNYHITSSASSQINLGVLTTSSNVVTVVMRWKWSGVDSVMPFGFNRYDIYLSGGSVGFNTANTDIFGIAIPADASTTFKTYIFKFKTGAYGEMWVDGVKQTLTQKLGIINTATAVVNNTNGYIFGWAGSADYRDAGSVDWCRVIDGDITDAEASALTTNIDYTSLKSAFGSRLIRNLEFTNKYTFCNATLINYVLSGTATFGLTNTAVNNIDILGVGTGLTLYTFDNTIANINANYPLTTTATVTYAAMKYGTGAKTTGYGSYMANTLTYTGAKRVYSFWVKWSVVTGYYNFCFGGNNNNTSGSTGYSWFINATNGYLSNVSTNYASCPVNANQLYHIVIEADHSNGDYQIYIDKVLKQSGVDSMFTRTRSTNNYQFFSFTASDFTYGTPPMMDQFRIINLGRTLTQADVNILYDEVVTGITITAPFITGGNKIVETSTGKTYTMSATGLTAGSTLAVGTNTYSFARQSAGMNWIALNLKGKIYNLTTNTLITTLGDITNSYGTVYNNGLQIASLLTDRTVKKYTLLNNFFGGEIVMLGTLPVGTLKMVGYWYGVYIKVDKLVEQRDICAVQTATQTIFYYNDGSNWNAFFTLNELTSFADSDSVIKNCNFEVLYGTYNPAGLTVNLASIPTGNAVVTNSGLAISLATSNTTTVPTSFDSLTPTSSVFNFDTATVTDSYGSWLSAINGNFLHTKLTGALTNLTSLTLNTVK